MLEIADRSESAVSGLVQETTTDVVPGEFPRMTGITICTDRFHVLRYDLMVFRL